MARAPTTIPDRGVPPLPPTPLSTLADDEPLPLKTVAAYARKSVVAVQCWKRHNTHPELAWQGSGRRGCRAFLLAGDLKRFLASPPRKRPRSRPKPGWRPPRPEVPLEALAPDMRLSTFEVAAYSNQSIDVVRQRRSQGIDAPLVWLRDGRTKTVTAGNLLEYLPVCRPMVKRVSGGRGLEPVQPARPPRQPPTPPARRSPPASPCEASRSYSLSEWDVLTGPPPSAAPGGKNEAPKRVEAPAPRPTGPKTFAPVTVAIAERAVTLTRVAEAATILTACWPPENRTAATYRQALEVCRDAIVGTVEPEAAREAFIAAAQGAGVSVKG